MSPSPGAVLLTGTTGFIGMELLARYLERSDGAGRHRFRERQQIIHAGVTPEAAIDAKDQKRPQPHDDQHGESAQEQFPRRTV